LRTQNPEQRLEAFKRAAAHDSFAKQEVAEQISQNAIAILREPKVSEKTKQDFGIFAEQQLLDLAASKPGDARVHVFIGSFYRTTGQLEKAAEQMALARQFSPHKPSIIIQQGFVDLSLGKEAESLVFFKEAFELEPRNLEAREYYAAALFYADKPEEAIALMDSDAAQERFAKSDFLLGAANEAGQTDFLISLFETRVKLDKGNAQTWATLAFLYHQKGDFGKAIAVLEEGKTAVPTFAKTASCIIDNIKNGKDPQVGCTADPAAASAAKAQ
jgi:tetratricopeptide (TPR) repeat protein